MDELEERPERGSQEVGMNGRKPGKTAPGRGLAGVWMVVALVCCAPVQWLWAEPLSPSPVDPTRIGVLLPLSGRFAPVGEEVRRGMELALEQQAPSPMGPFTVVYRDTKDDPALTEQAVHELVEEEHVVAIIGPLVSATVDAAAIAAAELEVPLVILSQKRDVPFLGNYVYRNFMTLEFQVRTLVAYAMDVLELRRFAIVYPQQRYWMEAAALFWDEVVARGGEIRGVESYPPGTKDFLEVARKLGRKYYLDLRRQELEEGTRQMREAYRKAGREPPKKPYELPPIVDFDAVFVPDQYGAAALLAASLAYAEFPVGKFAPDKKQTPVRLLGTSAWNSPDFILQGGDYVEGCLFVDNFFSQSPDPVVRAFVGEFQRVHGRKPEIFAAVGYDSVALLCSLLRARPLDRAGLLRRLSTMKGFSGATGTIAFDDHGELKKELFVITVHRERFEQLVPAPEQPETDGG